MFNKLTIKSRLFMTFGVIFVLLGIAIGVALNGTDVIGKEFDDFLEQNIERQTSYQRMYSNGLLSGVALRNLLLKPELTKPFKVIPDSITRFDEAYKHAASLAKTTAEKDALKTIDQHWKKTRAAKLEILDLVKQGKVKEGTDLLRTVEHPHWQKVRIQVQNLVKAEEELTASLKIDVLNHQSAVLRNTIIIALIALIVGFIIAFAVIRSIRAAFDRVVSSLEDIADGDGDLTKRLDTTGNNEISRLSEAFNHFVVKIQTLVQQVSASSAQLATSTQQMTALSVETKLNVNQQESKIEQVAAAINEMSATVQEVSRNASEASHAAQSADTESHSGKKIVSEVIDVINDLENQVRESSSTIKALDQHAIQIGGVLDVIKGIAEQTNLLALNAAIEAARAGEQGRGFAVVADEVRTLASRTQESTQEIQTMIEQLQDGAKNAVRSMESGEEKTQTTVTKAREAGAALETITEAISTIAHMNTQIATAAQEQSAVAEEINQNIVSISGLSVQAADGAEHTASNSQELERLTNSMRATVSTFII